MISFTDYVFEQIFITEAQKYFTKNAIEYLKEFKDDSDVYISYRNINKLGINPNNIYDTPIGIYAYPLKELFNDMLHKTTRYALHYVGEMPYIYIFRLKPEYKQLFLNDAIDYKPNNDNKKLIRFIENYYNISNISDVIDDIQNKMIFDNNRNIFGRTLFGSLYYKTYNLSLYIANKIESNNYTYIWNNLLRNGLNICGVADKSGKGLIHSNEPTQAVFFSKECIEEIKVVRNITDFVTYKDVNHKLEYTTKYKIIFNNDNLIIKTNGTFYEIIFRKQNNIIKKFFKIIIIDNLIIANDNIIFDSNGNIVKDNFDSILISNDLEIALLQFDKWYIYDIVDNNLKYKFDAKNVIKQQGKFNIEMYK